MHTFTIKLNLLFVVCFISVVTMNIENQLNKKEYTLPNDPLHKYSYSQMQKLLLNTNFNLRATAFLQKPLLDRNQVFVTVKQENSSFTFDSVVVETCNDCKTEYGSCKANKCVCKEEYAAYTEYKGDLPCSYNRKSNVVAFWLELLVPIGSSYFYLGKTGLGLLKLMVVLCFPILLLLIFCVCIKPSKNANTRNSTDLVFFVLAVLYLLSSIAWLLCDLIMILSKKYTDSNSVPMY